MLLLENQSRRSFIIILFVLFMIVAVMVATGNLDPVPRYIIAGLSLIIFLGVSLYFTPYIESPPGFLEKIPKLNRLDCVLTIFILMMILIGFVRAWGFNSPYISTAGDIENNVLGPIIAEQYPDNFQADLLLQDTDVFNVYQTLLNFIIKNITYPIIGEIGLATLILTIPILFIHNMGFYLLGLTVSRNRLITIFFVIIATRFGVLALGETWGIRFSPYPRLMFQSLLPYLMLFAIIWRNNPKRWIWLMIGSGLLVYIHSVSTPAWGFAIWLGFWIYHPSHWSFTKRLLVMFGLGCVFLLTITPFAINYLGSFQHGTTFDVDLVLQISIERFIIGFYDIELALQLFFDTMIREYFTPLLILIGVISIPFLKNHWRSFLTLMLVWVLGLLFVSVGLMWLDHTSAKLLHRLPLQVDLIRGLRYLVPIGFLILIGMATHISSLINRTPKFKIILYRLALLLLATTFYIFLVHSCNRISDLYNNPVIDQPVGAKIQLINYIHDNTEPGSTILSLGENSDLLPIRYASQRSLAWSRKDGALFAYGDTQRLITWYNLENVEKGVTGLEDEWIRYNHLLQQVNATYIVQLNDTPYTSNLSDSELRPFGLEIEYANDKYILLRLTEPLPYETVNLSEFSQQNNYDKRLEVMCNSEGIDMHDTQTDKSLTITYEQIQDATESVERPIIVSESDHLSLSLLTDAVLKGEIQDQSYFIFTLYRCDFDK